MTQVKRERTLRASSKARVLKLYPDAFAHSWADCWTIYSSMQGQVLADGGSPKQAWERAAARKGRRNNG